MPVEKELVNRNKNKVLLGFWWSECDVVFTDIVIYSQDGTRTASVSQVTQIERKTFPRVFVCEDIEEVTFLNRC